MTVDPSAAAAAAGGATAGDPIVLAIVAIFSSVSALVLKVAEMYFTSKKRATGEEIAPAELKRNYDATRDNYSQVSNSLKDLVRILTNVQEMVTRNEVRLTSLEARCHRLEECLDDLEARFNRAMDGGGENNNTLLLWDSNKRSAGGPVRSSRPPLLLSEDSDGSSGAGSNGDNGTAAAVDNASSSLPAHNVSGEADSAGADG